MGTPYIYYYRHTAQTSTLLRPPPTPLPFVLCIPHTILTSPTPSRVRAHTRTERGRGGESERKQRRPHTHTRTSKIAKVANFTGRRKRKRKRKAVTTPTCDEHSGVRSFPRTKVGSNFMCFVWVLGVCGLGLFRQLVGCRDRRRYGGMEVGSLAGWLGGCRTWLCFVCLVCFGC